MANAQVRRRTNGGGPEAVALPPSAATAGTVTPAANSYYRGDFASGAAAFIDDDLAVAQRARALCRRGALALPLPGAGATITRWQSLADVAREDLCVAKIVEAHADAQAIIAELGGDPGQGMWGVFAAEPPSHRVDAAHCPDGGWVLNGRKAWCTGAAIVDHALVTAQDARGSARLFAVDLDHRGITRSDASWAAVGMRRARTFELLFHDVAAQAVGNARAYVERAGFWHGAMGIAACWYGGMTGLADALLEGCRHRASPHALAHLGACDAWIRGASSLLAQSARQIDADPKTASPALALAVRAQVELAANAVSDHVGRALGATPYCMDSAFAMRSADLAVFIRQSHAESDLEALGRLCVDAPPAWTVV